MGKSIGLIKVESKQPCASFTLITYREVSKFEDNKPVNPWLHRIKYSGLPPVTVV